MTLKAARDKDNLYFYARTAAPLTTAGTNWMWLLIDADQNAATGWAGYDFIVNRRHDADGTFWLEKNVGGWNWQPVARLPRSIAGSELQLAIPRKLLVAAPGARCRK